MEVSHEEDVILLTKACVGHGRRYMLERLGLIVEAENLNWEKMQRLLADVVVSMEGKPYPSKTDSKIWNRGEKCQR